MNLGTLIEWLEKQDPDMIVSDGFSTPHSDRGDYSELAFTPEESARIGDMLRNARDSDGALFRGYKGGEYRMNEYTPVHIGEFGDCGEEITGTHCKYWLLTARKEGT